MGFSGAGKSTLLYALSGIDHLTLFENVAVTGYLDKDKSAKAVKVRTMQLLKMINVKKACDRLPSQVSGLLVPSNLPLGLCLLSLAVIMLLLISFIVLKTSKVDKITPLRAIKGGANDIYFKNRFAMPIHKKCMNMWLALRQLTSSKKQYMSACLVTALLVFFMSLVARIGTWMVPDGAGMMIPSQESMELLMP